jgi:hypothetical protein
MIWLTWRQFRLSALPVLVVVLVAAAALAVAGPRLADLLTTSGDDFFDRLALEDGQRVLFYLGTALAYALPAVVGVFWGAPMVARELEAGTHRLVWTQSITRSHWLGTKLALTGLGAALAGLIGLALAWWSQPLDDAVARGLTDGGPLSMPRLWPQVFGSRGLVPLAMALFALAVGVAWGMYVRRTVAAMALTLVTVVAAQIVLPVLLQEHLVGAEILTTKITNENLRGIVMSGAPGAADPMVGNVHVAIDRPGAWVTHDETVGPDGDVVVFLPAWAQACAPGPGEGSRAESDACFTRLADEGYRQQVSYVPDSRYWALQGVESGILLVLAGGAVGLSFWRIRRDF